MTLLTYQTGDAQESRTAAFGAGATTHYENRGVQQLEENVPSALSLGLNPDDPRTSTFQGQRYEQTSPNGRSDQTSQANPQFEQL